MEEDRPINPTPPSHTDIVNAIRVCATLGAKTKTEIEHMIREEWLYGHSGRIGEAMIDLHLTFQGLDKLPRQVIRKARNDRKMTFSELIKKKLKK